MQDYFLVQNNNLNNLNINNPKSKIFPTKKTKLEP